MAYFAHGMRIIEECGTAIAFPSQTTYHVHENAREGEQPRVAPAANAVRSNKRLPRVYWKFAESVLFCRSRQLYGF